MIIRIIGCGKIGSMFARMLSTTHQLILESRNKYKLDKLKEELNYQDIAKNLKPQITILAVKPQDLGEVAKKYHFENEIIVSTLAGLTLEKLKAKLGNLPIFRIIPNLACNDGNGIIGIAINEESEANKELITTLFKPCGKTFWIEEKKFNGFTSLTSSGPAFIALIIEAMTDAGISMGFSAEQSLNYIFSMMEGTIHHLQHTNLHPAVFKWNVTSPGGMTIEGIKMLEQAGVRSGIIQALLATQKRGDELN